MIKKLFLLFSLLLVFSFDQFAQSGSFKGRVVGIVDGDTVTILDKENRQTIIRLAGIDAPEKRQDFGNAAKEFLAKLIFEKKVTVIAGKIDRYGRTTGIILLDGKDINLLMVEAGFAWHYKEYEDEQSAADRESYAEAEQTARKGNAGLWQQRDAVKPSEFRRAEKDDAARAQRPPAPPARIIIPVPNSSGGGGDSPNEGSQNDAPSGEKAVRVKGYTRKDGTYVEPHTRSAPRRKN